MTTQPDHNTISTPPTEQAVSGGSAAAAGVVGLFSALDTDAAHVEIEATGIRIHNAADWLAVPPAPEDPILEGVFDRGDKLAIIAQSKMRKTFYALQLCCSLAAGVDFLGWRTRGPFRVLVIQFEIRDHHFHRRLHRMMEAMGLELSDIGDRLHVVNARGAGLDPERIARIVECVHADVVLLDPLYKLTEGDENSKADVAATLNLFDRICEATGAALVYVHHDKKGDASKQDVRDRGAGSGVLARDYDAALTLTPHRDQEDHAVVHTLLRNYAPVPAFCIAWEEGHFVVDDAAPAVTGKPSQYHAPLSAYFAQNPGASLSDAAAAVGCNKSTVSRWKTTAGVA